MKIGLASTQSISHQRVYSYIYFHSSGAELNRPRASGRMYVYLMTQLPSFITCASWSLQRTGSWWLMMLTLRFCTTADNTFECAVNNRDWMKVIHFNHTTARPPSHYPRGLLYLSTFSFLLLFFFGLGWWQGNCFVGRLPLKNQTTEGDIFTYCRCGVGASCIKCNALTV